MPVRQVLLFPPDDPDLPSKAGYGCSTENGWVGPARTEMRSAEMYRLTLFGVSVHGGRIGASRAHGWPSLNTTRLMPRRVLLSERPWRFTKAGSSYMGAQQLWVIPWRQRSKMLLYNLVERKKRYGIATICLSCGNAACMLVENMML